MYDTRRFSLDSTGALVVSWEYWNDVNLDPEPDYGDDDGLDCLAPDHDEDELFPRFAEHWRRLLWDGLSESNAAAVQLPDEAIVRICDWAGRVTVWLTTRDGAADALRDWTGRGTVNAERVQSADAGRSVCPYTGRQMTRFRATIGQQWIEVRTVRSAREA